MRYSNIHRLLMVLQVCHCFSIDIEKQNLYEPSSEMLVDIGLL